MFMASMATVATTTGEICLPYPVAAAIAAAVLAWVKWERARGDGANDKLANYREEEIDRLHEELDELKHLDRHHDGPQ